MAYINCHLTVHLLALISQGPNFKIQKGNQKNIAVFITLKSFGKWPYVPSIIAHGVDLVLNMNILMHADPNVLNMDTLMHTEPTGQVSS